jgi:hypothetical protein
LLGSAHAVAGSNAMVRRPSGTVASEMPVRLQVLTWVAMAATAQSAIAVIGIDIGKNSFHIVGLDGRGAIVLRQKAIFSRLPGNALAYCT